MSVAWLTAQWPAPPGVCAISTYRGGGVSGEPYASLNLGDHVGDEPARVADNRARLRSAAHLPVEPTWLAQVHGTDVADLDAGAAGPADAVVARHTRSVCAILTADCLPILLVSDSGDAIGAAHAGWRGLAAGVIEAAVGAMRTPPAQLLAWLGPCIGPRHFEVGNEVREAFLAQDEGAQAAFSPNARGRFLADLPALARRRLQSLGLERIYGGTECTYSDRHRYFSHRRDGKTGRQASLIWRQYG